MKRRLLKYSVALLVVQWSQPTIAQQAGDLTVPFIDRPPELADFPGMEASVEIDRMMARAQGFGR